MAKDALSAEDGFERTRAALRDLGYDAEAVERMVAAARPQRGGAEVPDVSAPLSGVTVVDLTRVLSGPLCTHILSELGARVIKIETSEEKPGQLGSDSHAGDVLRGSPGFFAAVNHSKECIALDLRSADDKALLERMLEKADVLVENFRPGVMEEMGFAWSRLQRRYPALVYCSISGYGHTGPDAALPAMDVVVQARSGLMSVTGHEGTPPTGLGVQLADMAGGLYGAIGVLGALARQRRSGLGARVDVAMLDACVALLCPLLPRVGRGHPQPDRRGAASQHSAPFNVFECSDGAWLAIVALQPHFWRSLCGTLGVSWLAEDPRFANNGQRLKNRTALEERLQEAFKRRPQQEWLAALRSEGVPCAPVNQLADVLQDAQVLARHMIATTEDGHVVPGSPLKISGWRDGSTRPSSPVVDALGRALRAEFVRPSKL